MPSVPEGVRVVYFDAVGTLIRPEPSAGAVYAEIGKRFSSRMPIDEIRQRFAPAFEAQEVYDAARGHRTDETREEQRWRAIVAEVLEDVNDLEGCFQELYAHFASPSSWRILPTVNWLRSFEQAGLLVGIASNFDHRLHQVLSGIQELSNVKSVIVSSEIGWKKPSPRFFAHLCTIHNLSPSQMLFIGDNRINDYEGARAAGLRAWLLE